jgi:hypothetical protein
MHNLFVKVLKANSSFLHFKGVVAAKPEDKRTKEKVRLVKIEYF